MEATAIINTAGGETAGARPEKRMDMGGTREKGTVTDKETIALCALNTVFGFEPKTAHALIRHFGGAAAVFESSPQERAEACPYNDKLRALSSRHLERAQEELSGLGGLCEDPVTFVPISDSRYPKLLAQCPDAPLGLYVRSSRPLEEIFDGGPDVAVVGTRDISAYGRQWCREIIRAMARSEHPPRIVSGLAYGTDIIAHTTALECGLPTAAVMATGADKVYPYVHSGWAGRIADAHGSALISDYPPGTAPLRINFLRRNRIIAGLCHATILIESKARGGGLLTARLAFDYDRDVFALPGRIDDVRSQGCNRLIRMQLARPIESAEALVEELGLGLGMPGQAQHDMPDCPGVSRAQMETLMSAVRQRHAAAIDELAAMTGIPVPEVSSAVALLEAEGLLSTDLLGRCTLR